MRAPRFVFTALTTALVCWLALVGGAPAAAAKPHGFRYLHGVQASEAIPQGSRHVLLVGEGTITRIGPGDRIDRGFGTDGRVEDEAIRVGVQPDGKIIVLGGFRRIVTRLTPEGRPDPSFGKDGTVPLAAFPRFETEDAMTVSATGIVLGGEVAGTGKPALARLRPNGAIDRGFGHDGVKVIGTEEFPEIEDLETLPGGGYLVTEQNDDEICEFTAAGRVRRSFGNDGCASSLRFGHRGPGVGFSADDLPLVLPGGELIVYGDLSRYVHGENQYTVGAVRLRADGSRDRSYGRGGFAYLPFDDLYGPGEDGFSGGAAFGQGGKLVIGASLGIVTGMALVTFDSDGHLDQSLGEGGKVLVGEPFVGYADAGPVILRPDRQALLFGVEGTAPTSIVRASLAPRRAGAVR
jgi:uncharacterized delta-60 repeat protein